MRKTYHFQNHRLSGELIGEAGLVISEVEWCHENNVVFLTLFVVGRSSGSKR